MSTLVIVESPAKARTISKFLGRRYAVKASMGHVRDLPKSQFGVDVNNNFAPRYITVRGQGEVLRELKALAEKSGKVLLATDPDREGEAISWHLSEVLKLDPSQPIRIVFHEITKEAIQKAVGNPQPIDMRLVDAQQARRVLDRVVGYKLSPFLWEKIKPGLSAGRVQSPALRLICDREKEIEEFVKEEYWTIDAYLVKGESGREFQARLHQADGQKIAIKSEAEASALTSELKRAVFTVENVQRSERRRKPPPPFTTSTLQQEAARRLSFTARRTMTVAQQLYEGLDIGAAGPVGLITYLRTDSTNIAEVAQKEARAFIEQNLGPEYRPAKPPQYKTPAGAQAAHEAIRPTSVERRPETLKEYLTRDQYLLYNLIWQRFLASQMTPAVYDTVNVDIKAVAAGESGTPRRFLLKAGGSTLKFPGYLSIYKEQAEEDKSQDADQEGANNALLPDLQPDEVLSCRRVEPAQHFTQPPPRYTEATLVKTLEELGLGRPSTYVTIIDTLLRRGYVTREDRRFVPTELGKITVALLKKHFPDVVDVEFTAQMEKALDAIEEGNREWTSVMRAFYDPFMKTLEQAHVEAEEVQISEEVTEEKCPSCGRNMVIKWGRFGKFMACPGYPACRNTKPLSEDIGVPCPKCGQPLVARHTKRGRTFYGCKGYPQCRFTSWQKPVPQACPQCGGLMVEQRRRGKEAEWVCADKACGFRKQAGQ